MSGISEIRHVRNVAPSNARREGFIRTVRDSAQRWLCVTTIDVKCLMASDKSFVALISRDVITRNVADACVAKHCCDQESFEREITVLSLLDGTNLAPKVFHVDAQSQTVFMEYLPYRYPILNAENVNTLFRQLGDTHRTVEHRIKLFAAYIYQVSTLPESLFGGILDANSSICSDEILTRYRTLRPEVHQLFALIDLKAAHIRRRDFIESPVFIDLESARLGVPDIVDIAMSIDRILPLRFREKTLLRSALKGYVEHRGVPAYQMYLSKFLDLVDLVRSHLNPDLRNGI